MTKRWRPSRLYIPSPIDCSTHDNCLVTSFFSCFEALMAFPRRTLISINWESTLRVFWLFSEKSLRGSYDTWYISIFDLVTFKCQNFSEEGTTNGNTKKSCIRPAKSGTVKFVWLNCENIENLALQKHQIWPKRPNLLRAKPWACVPKLLEPPKNLIPGLGGTTHYIFQPFPI